MQAGVTTCIEALGDHVAIESSTGHSLDEFDALCVAL